MNFRILFFFILGVDALTLFLQIPGLSIAPHEARIFYESDSLLHHIVTLSTSLFGNNHYALRLPMLILHVMSVLLFYDIAKPYIKYERDRLWISVIYMLLPGVISASLLVNSAGIVLFFLMLYIYMYQRCYKASYLLLPLLFLVDESFMFLYVGIALYAFEQKKQRLMFVSIALFVASAMLYGFDFGGRPRGAFVDTLALYAAIFSPIVFVYLFYVLYRRTVLGHRDQLYYIATSAFVISLLLSFRQKIEIETFAPFLMIALPLAMQTFFHSYRVRLSQFRKRYWQVFSIAFGLLMIHAVIVFFHREMYLFLENPKEHVTYRMHIPEALSSQLKSEGILCLDTQKKKLQKQLRFYGIGKCDTYRLETKKLSDKDLNVTIMHRNIPIYIRYVTKVHNK